MSFFYGFHDELDKLAAEDGESPSKVKGALVGGGLAAAAHHGLGELNRRRKETPFELADTIERLKGTRGPVGGAVRNHAARVIKNSKNLLRSGGEAGKWHGALAKTLPAKILAGMGVGAGIQALRHRGEKKEAAEETALAKNNLARRVAGNVRDFAGKVRDTHFPPGSVGRRVAVGAGSAGAAALGGGLLLRHARKKREAEKQAGIFNRARDAATRAGGYVRDTAREAGGELRDFVKTPSFSRNVVLPIVAGGAALGAGGEIIARHRRKKREAEKQAGIFTRAPKPGMLSGLASKIPKKKIVAGGLAAAGAYGAGRHAGRKKGEGEAMQVGEQSYEAGARDMQGALMSELGIS